MNSTSKKIEKVIQQPVKTVQPTTSTISNTQANQQANTKTQQPVSKSKVNQVPEDIKSQNSQKVVKIANTTQKQKNVIEVDQNTKSQKIDNNKPIKTKIEQTPQVIKQSKTQELQQNLNAKVTQEKKVEQKSNTIKKETTAPKISLAVANNIKPLTNKEKKQSATDLKNKIKDVPITAHQRNNSMVMKNKNLVDERKSSSQPKILKHGKTISVNNAAALKNQVKEPEKIEPTRNSVSPKDQRGRSKTTVDPLNKVNSVSKDKDEGKNANKSKKKQAISNAKQQSPIKENISSNNNKKTTNNNNLKVVNNQIKEVSKGKKNEAKKEKLEDADFEILRSKYSEMKKEREKREKELEILENKLKVLEVEEGRAKKNIEREIRSREDNLKAINDIAIQKDIVLQAKIEQNEILKKNMAKTSEIKTQIQSTLTNFRTKVKEKNKIIAKEFLEEKKKVDKIKEHLHNEIKSDKIQKATKIKEAKKKAELRREREELRKEQLLKQKILKELEKENNKMKLLENKYETFSTKENEMKAKLIETKLLDLNSKSMIDLGGNYAN